MLLVEFYLAEIVRSTSSKYHVDAGNECFMKNVKLCDNKKNVF